MSPFFDIPESRLEHGHEKVECLSPQFPTSIPTEDFVKDSDLNNQREVLASIRKERAESWQLDVDEDKKSSGSHPNNRAKYHIAITNMNHFGEEQSTLQSLAKGTGEKEEGILAGMITEQPTEESTQ